MPISFALMQDRKSWPEERDNELNVNRKRTHVKITIGAKNITKSCNHRRNNVFTYLVKRQNESNDKRIN